MKRRFTLLLIAVIAMLMVLSSAYAVEPLALHMEGTVVEGQKLNIYCNTNVNQPLDKGQFSVSLGTTALEINEVKTFSSSNAGVSYIFLADVSGSISKNKLNSIKETLSALADHMTSLDNASVLTVGNEAYAQPFVSDKAKILEQISAIEGMRENTNLYAGIVKGLDILSTDEKSNQKKCLIVFSDGEDYGIKGITREEVNQKIEKQHIPVFTVAMLDAKPKQKYIDSSKVLGSFARLSPGGLEFIHELKAESSAQIAASIRSTLDNSLILSADLTGFQSQGNEQFLKLELSVSGQGKVSDGYSIPTGALSVLPASSEPAASPVPTPTEQPIVTPAPTKEPEQPKPTKTPWMLIGIGGLVVICAGILIAVIFTKKKRKSDVSIIESMPDFEAERAVAFEEPVYAFSAEPEAIRGVSIRFTKVGLIEEEVYHAVVKDELFIGRDAAKNGLSFPEDDLLSSRHCVLRSMENKLILQDCGSTNGTFVNGVPIRGERILENDDVLLIGSMELRVNW